MDQVILSFQSNYGTCKTKIGIRYCKLIEEDRLDLLVHSTKEDIMTFLKWVLDTYPRVRKRSSLHEYWRIWRMLYRKSVGQSLHAKVMEEVNDVCSEHPLIKPFF